MCVLHVVHEHERASRALPLAFLFSFFVVCRNKAHSLVLVELRATAALSHELRPKIGAHHGGTRFFLLLFREHGLSFA